MTKMSLTLKNILMKLLEYPAIRRLSGADGAMHSGAGDLKAQDTGRRLREIYGAEKMDRQLLYEHWAVKDTWHLRDEALPLLCGIDPDFYKNSSAGLIEDEAIKELRLHARQCIEHDLLRVVNREQDADDWRVEPLGIYQWAVISRLQLPAPLVAIMEFIGRTVKKSPQSAAHLETPDGRHLSSALDKDREKVLGLALATLAARPEQCRNADGVVTAEQLVETSNALFFLQKHTLKLADGAMLDLIDKWLKVKPPT